MITYASCTKNPTNSVPCGDDHLHHHGSRSFLYPFSWNALAPEVCNYCCVSVRCVDVLSNTEELRKMTQEQPRLNFKQQVPPV